MKTMRKMWSEIARVKETKEGHFIGSEARQLEVHVAVFGLLWKESFEGR